MKHVGNTGSVKAADQLENPVIGSYPLLRPPVLVSSLSAPENFEMSSASSNSTNPLLVEHEVEDQILREPFKNIADYRESDSVDRSVSNVLSLAERVRNLKTGMKKA
jgi:hypothetical protein